jgi:hypothetical protein
MIQMPFSLAGLSALKLAIWQLPKPLFSAKTIALPQFIQGIAQN